MQFLASEGWVLVEGADAVVDGDAHRGRLHERHLEEMVPFSQAHEHGAKPLKGKDFARAAVRSRFRKGERGWLPGVDRHHIPGSLVLSVGASRSPSGSGQPGPAHGYSPPGRVTLRMLPSFIHSLTALCPGNTLDASTPWRCRKCSSRGACA